MTEVLRGVDLNLLVALDALLREQSVTRAAHELQLSQPSLSASLARLRRHFGDPLLVRDGNRLTLTPFAVRLRQQVEISVAEASKLFGHQIQFEPGESRREFRLVVSDYGASICLPKVTRALSQHAPHARVRVVHISTDFVNGAPESLRSVDAMILPLGAVSHLPHQELYEDRWVVVASRSNRLLSDGLTPDLLGRLPWALPFDASFAFAPVVNQLRVLGVEMRAEVITQTFLSIPALVEGTDRLALLQERLARRVTDEWGLERHELPLDAAPIRQALWWHPVHHEDSEHRWFRTLAIDAGRDSAEQ